MATNFEGEIKRNEEQIKQLKREIDILKKMRETGVCYHPRSRRVKEKMSMWDDHIKCGICGKSEWTENLDKYYAEGIVA